MKKFSTKLLSILMACILLVGIAAGCGQSGKTDTTTASTSTAATSAADKIDALTLPIVKEPITLTYYASLGSILASKVKSIAETPTYLEYQKRTGIKLEFIHPAVGQEAEQFKLMIASKEYPDIIQANFVGYEGGPEKAMAENIIIPLNELIEKYAPNLRKYLSENKEIDKLVKTDSGKYYGFPSLRPDPSTLVYLGPAMRKDWLDEAGMPIPETNDEWYAALKYFKDVKGATAAFTVHKDDVRWNDCFVGGFNVGRDFFKDGNTVKFGPYQPEYKDFLMTANKWYAEGLLDPDFATNDKKAFEAKITTEQAGAYYNYSDTPSKYTKLINEAGNPKAVFEPVPYPVPKKGEVSKFGQYSSAVRTAYYAHISTANKYPKETAMFLDYAFSEEGNILFNFGIEGDSYNMVNGYPTYTDKIMKDPKGLSEALATYVFSGPFITDGRYFEQTLADERQKNAIKIWASHKAGDYKMPPLTPTPEDSKRLSEIMSEINTYCDEMYLNFITGITPISEFDSYIAQLKKMGIEEAIALKQKALDAFNKR